MCIKKLIDWLNGPDPAEPMTTVQRRLLTFGKNNYGGSNDLNGCINDSKNLANRTKTIFPNADCRIFIDSEVTVSNYTKQVTAAIATLQPGALVIVIADSCFSESVTRFVNGTYYKSRFMHPGLPIRHIIRKKLLQRPDLKLVELSGSSEAETSADVYVNGSYQGALTYAVIKSLQPDFNCREIYSLVSAILPGKISDQHPKLTGPAELLDRKLSEGQLLIVHNSSHGSWQYDQNGDEADGRDEGLYFDRFFPDDDIYEIYKQIP